MTVNPPALSEADILAMMIAAELPTSGPQYETYRRYIEEAYDEIAADVATAERDALLATLQQTASPEVLRAIEERAARNAKDLITQVTRAELTKIAAQITEAQAMGMGPREVARKLEAVKGLDAPRAKSYDKYVAELKATDLSQEEIDRRAAAYHKKLLKDRRETIARTEMRKGTSEVKAIDARERGAKYKVWQTVGDDRVSDECQANEAQGPIPIDEEFAGGVDTAPQHPNCRCAVSFLTNPALLPEWEQRAADRAAATEAAKADTSE